MSTSRNGLKARDIMVHEPVCVEPSATIRQLAKVFEEHEISGAPVIDRDGRVIGVVSKTDLIRRCSEGTIDVPPAYLFELLDEQSGEDAQIVPEPLICVEDFMTEDPITVTVEAPAAEIAHLMVSKRIHRVIVVDADHFPVGIITSLDLLGTYGQPSMEATANRKSK